MLDVSPMSPDEPVAAVAVELAGVRRRLDGVTGRRYWKSLEELAESPGFLEFLHREFPEQASAFEDPKGRREFLTLMGASLALAGLTACTKQPPEKILPYVRQPEDLVLGRPLFYATAVAQDGFARGILVESHEGRPTKIEGNPDHPQSLGATDVFGQAHVLGLYDPDRSQTVKYYGQVRPWSAFRENLATALAKLEAKQGSGLRFLSGTLTSPTLASQMQAVLARFPKARFHSYDPAGRDNTRAGAILAFGEVVETQLHLDKADVILSLDADFVGEGPASLRLIREFARRRRPGAHGPEGASEAPGSMNRLYVVEGTPTPTGASADHCLSLRSSEIEGLARAVAAGLGLPVEGAQPAHAEWVGPLVKDLQGHAGSAVVAVGEGQPPAVHALGHAINEKLGAFGKTVSFTASSEASRPDQAASLAELTTDMTKRRVDLLVIFGGNPAYDAPADVPFVEALDNVPLRVHLGLYEDETAERCHWHIPEAHPLEAWSDARAACGTVSVVQPLIAPLYGGTSVHELLAAFTARPDETAYDAVREHWKGEMGADFEKRWPRALHDGVVAGTALPDKTVAVRPGEWARAPKALADAGLEIVFRSDPGVRDGRFSNIGWLQELPKPLTKLTWENVAIVSPRLALRLGLAITQDSLGHQTDVVSLEYQGRSVKAPVWIQPGQPDDSVTVHLGYGRTRAGRVGTGAGFSAYKLRTAAAPWFGAGLVVKKAGERATLACTQDHWSIDNAANIAAHDRHLIRSASLADYEKDPRVFQAMGEDPKREMSLYEPGFKYEGHAWGMSIDLGSCVGCNACITACQSENNIPVVGKDQVARGREMHWIRVDRYYEGPAESPKTFHQPVLCMHCENAPCEVVCPVAATVHSDEGLNDMVYNRCVGTRYCSNNCPYKVRRFNFFLYQDWTTPSLKMMRNPDVTVRSRGVMEKCTYCVQRINRARIDAKNERRAIRDGEIKTACEAACPAEAIVFGDVNDPASEVRKRKAEPRSYGLLTELQTRPRTTYLAAFKNPNPDMPGAALEAPHG
jgi:MoCo/4Fe-4S cofactor protein with predicted Tat translocation signal